MVFGPQRHVLPCSVTLAGTLLPVVSEYPYLGVILTPSLSWTPHVRHLVSRGNRLFAQCVAWGRFLLGWPPGSPIASSWSLVPDEHLAFSRLPWTSLICVSSPKCVYMCVKRCPSQTPNAFICVSPNAFICVSPNAFICVSPNAFICVSPNAFICVSPNAFICVSPNAFADATELASLAYLCSLRSHVF